MPTYDYECSACKHIFEEFQGINAPVLTKCPKCGKNKLHRLFGTGAAIVFKGSGFYQTDYRSEGYKKAAEADKKSTSDAKPEQKSDTKSETKSETKKSETPKPKKKSDQ